MQTNDLPLHATEHDLRNAWRARLALRYTHEAGRTVLAQRRHEGPLAVQKSLYPEGQGICHNFILHPPAGIAGGDELDIAIDMGTHAHVVLSTPGAGKWYRSSGHEAQQYLRFKVAADAMLEWLPSETIFYSGAHAALHTRIDLSDSAAYLGWEITCMGRPASGELFSTGSMKQCTEIYRDDRLLWHERGVLSGNDPLLDSKVGLCGYSINATLLAVGRDLSVVSAELLRAIRALHRDDCMLAATTLGGVVVLRHLGHSAQVARECFADARALLRPWLCGVPAAALRIWRT